MDTFFTIYFFIVGGLFILNLISVLIKFLTGDGEDWQFHLAEDVLNWCLMLYPIRKRKPLLTLVEGKSNLAGEYCFYNNTITIYKDNNVIRRELINTVIHEYFHYYLITSESKSKLYHDQLEQFSLAQHPQEILCNTMGETLTKVYLKNN
jgi:glycosyltransferase involved in cell wall biosynthesis